MKQAAKKRTKDKDADLDRHWSSFKKVKAAISEEMVGELEQHAQRAEKAEGATRRIALVVLSKPTEFLISTFREDRQAALAFCDASLAMGEMIKRLDAVREVVTAARTRIDFAMVEREDMREVMEEARKHREAANV